MFIFATLTESTNIQDFILNEFDCFLLQNTVEKNNSISNLTKKNLENSSLVSGEKKLFNILINMIFFFFIKILN